MPIPTIDIQRKDLITLYEQYFWTNGGEGDIYKIPVGQKHILMKVFYDPIHDCPFWPRSVLQNKENKSHLLKTIILPNKIQIMTDLSMEKEFIGYVMNEAEDFQNFSYSPFNAYQKLELLRRLKNQLKRFHQLGIIYGDLKTTNVLSHTQNYRLHCLCDLDNMNIGSFQIDAMSENTKKFLEQYGCLDEKLDWYFFNVLTIESIFYLNAATTHEAYYETEYFIKQYRGKSETLHEVQHVTPKYEGNLLIDDPIFLQEAGIPYCLK